MPVSESGEDALPPEVSHQAQLTNAWSIQSYVASQAVVQQAVGFVGLCTLPHALGRMPTSFAFTAGIQQSVG